ncbi:MAG TPA: cysteine desulfurase family protein [Pirellulaceae bacterium]|nr:cysteine desulfurase family protein [Pirellulaceae bacterium]HMO91350.1 cysteine desulfurase family protein [Pirellulaceae bacterium]HMP70258.1 cysteine desulfurase family protein [Pirellulaceae bacterium]
MNSIYLDNNATTPLDDRVLQTINTALQRRFANPASAHQDGQIALRELQRMRESILQQLGAVTSGMHSCRLIFTSGGTESNNLALRGLATARQRTSRTARRIIISAIEHPSIAETAASLAREGWRIDYLHVEHDGVASLQHLEELLAEPAALVSVTSVNHETGVCQPIPTIAQLCADSETLFHTDAVQAVGKVPVHFSDNSITALTVTAHKVHGPRGIGGLVIAHGTEIEPILFGGSQQLGARPGTEDVALSSGFARSIELAIEELETRTEHLTRIRNRFEEQLLAYFGDSIRIMGQNSPRAPHTSNIAFLGCNRQAVVMAADMVGIRCSTGSACTSGSSEPSLVLKAMGRSKAEIDSSVRFSFNFLQDESLVREAVQKIIAVVVRLLGKKAI